MPAPPPPGAASIQAGGDVGGRPGGGGGGGFAMRSPNVCLQSSRCASTQPRRSVLRARVASYYIKFRYSEKATKFEIISHFFSRITYYRQNKVGDLKKFFWPFQNIWTLTARFWQPSPVCGFNFPNVAISNGFWREQRVSSWGYIEHTRA